MTNTVNNSARENVAKAVTSAYVAGSQSSGAIARIAQSVLALVTSGNDASVTLVYNKADVVVSAETLTAYAQGTLPTKADPDSDTPTVTQLVGALADTSDTYRKAVARKADHDAKAKKGNPLAVVTHKAEADKIAQALNTAKQPIRRALTLAGYIIGCGDYDAANTEERDGILWAAFADQVGGTESAIPVSFNHAREQIKEGKAERTPQTNTGTNEEQENAPVLELSQEAFRAGGKKRDGLADAIALFGDLLAHMDTAPTKQERASLQTLWARIGTILDDDAILEASEMQDAMAATKDAA